MKSELKIEDEAINEEQSLVIDESDKPSKDDNMNQEAMVPIYNNMPQESIELTDDKNDLLAEENYTDQIEYTNEDQTEDKAVEQTGETGSWSFQAKRGIVASPILVNDKLFFGSKDCTLYAVDINTHNEVWYFETENAIYCQAVVLDNTLL